MKNIIIGVILITLFLGVGCATTQHRDEYLHLTEHVWWQPVNRHEEKGVYKTIEFVPIGESAEDWSELKTLQAFAKISGSPEAFFNGLKTLGEKQCPGLQIWNVIAKDEHSILYEWKSKPCAGWPHQHEIAKVLDGKWNRFRISYTAKVQELPAEKRDEWIQILSKATIKVK